MAAIDLSTITIPSPQAYASDEPTRNQENYHNVLLQMLTQAKANSEPYELGAETASLTVDLSALITAVQDLKFNGQEIDLGVIRIILDGQTLSVG